MSDDAHAKALDEACRAVCDGPGEVYRPSCMSVAVTAYLAAMAKAGWVMVRDVGEMGTDDGAEVDYIDGWNACRAAIRAQKETKS